MAMIRKQPAPIRSVFIENYTIRPPKFAVIFVQTKEQVEGPDERKEWTYTTPNGSMLELGRVIHSWLRHGLLPSNATKKD